MSFLDKIKEIGDTCPLCGIELSCVLILSNVSNNSYSYTLVNKEYPILFSRTNPITLDIDSITINKDDQVEISHNDIIRVSYTVNCPSQHYNVDVYTMYASGELRFLRCNLNTDYLVEKLKFDEFMIENFVNSGKTHISKIGSIKNQFGQIFPSYVTLFKIPIRPIKSWPVKDINSFKEKINKLILLL